jgi:cell filamentation protein
MARIEQRELIRTTEWAAQTYGAEHRFTVQDVCELHRTWLMPIYAWAGEYRQVNVSKGGFLFAAAHLIPSLMSGFEAECLARTTPLEPERSGIALALAETHTELLLIHPFREGNGRVARLLCTLMAWQAGLQTPAFDAILKRRKLEYFAAVRAGLDRNYQPMSTLFASVIGGLQ